MLHKMTKTMSGRNQLALAQLLIVVVQASGVPIKKKKRRAAYLPYIRPALYYNTETDTTQTGR